MINSGIEILQKTLQLLCLVTIGNIFIFCARKKSSSTTPGSQEVAKTPKLDINKTSGAKESEQEINPVALIQVKNAKKKTADRQGKSIEKHLKSKDGPTTKITSSGTPCSSSSPAGNSETPLCSKESTIGSSNYLKLDG
ncbi:uncharacterized protein CELE_K07F5.17 [Caenorhabditis elegans]|uniref:Uncharacterized protein n=1 Tax=Caenorhabditis elegans TaxID=6239 RepID=A1EHR2_CAEEL|nr:Uncharacterized protein CELE_K07F5.17 [Caenorhabditis elegans]CAL90888.3 Uncharacterized protein CELE_K07F5.17 [Caenorhabditis elegans]|eukprot:NP_001076694.3 Uncharacterized protein CELE_K07F5.17 [Caenorhabditis elegans]